MEGIARVLISIEVEDVKAMEGVRLTFAGLERYLRSVYILRTTRFVCGTGDPIASILRGILPLMDGAIARVLEKMWVPERSRNVFARFGNRTPPLSQRKSRVEVWSRNLQSIATPNFVAWFLQRKAFQR